MWALAGTWLGNMSRRTIYVEKREVILKNRYLREQDIVMEDGGDRGIGQILEFFHTT